MVLLTERCIKHSLNENALKIKIGELYKAFIWYLFILLYPYSEFYIIIICTSSGIIFVFVLFLYVFYVFYLFFHSNLCMSVVAQQ